MSATLASLADMQPEMTAAIAGHPDAVDVDDRGVLRIEAGGNEITIGPSDDEGEDEDDGFDENLAETMDETTLAAIASELIRDIQTDDNARQAWLKTREQGIAMLGLKIEEARGDIGSTTAPLEGMSTYRSAELLQAVLRAQATARGELLPAAGPVKVTDTSTDPSAQHDERAEILETELNVYLTQSCPEYYPDTDSLLFWTAFGGVGFKKGYHCPLRRRPVLEQVDAADIIVSPGAATLESALRVTHRIRMKDSDVRRLIASGEFRAIALTQANADLDTLLDKKGQEMGLDPRPQTPADMPRTLYEVNCERVIPDRFRPDGLPDDVPLPYQIVIDKDAQTVLSMRRRWEPDDPMAIGTLDLIRYPYVEGMGIYAIGLVHIVGNSTRALTAATREMLDAGMFANFPGFIYDERVARQLTNEFRVPPGGGVKVQTGGARLQDMITPLPYKDVSPSLLALIQHVEQNTEKLAGTAELPTGEGAAQMPVGTVLALIDQATKPLDAVHKRLHAAQAEEFRLLKRLLREDPGAIRRHAKRLISDWDEDAFRQALEEFDLAPVSDPNVPTHSHRLLKAAALKQLSTMNPMAYDAKAVDSHILHLLGFSNPDQFFAQPQPQQPNPMEMAAQAQTMQAQAKMADTQAKLQIASEKAAIDKQKLGMQAIEASAKGRQEEADRQSAEHIEAQKLQADQMRLSAEMGLERQKMGAEFVKKAAEGMAPQPDMAPLGGAPKPRKTRKP